MVFRNLACNETTKRVQHEPCECRANALASQPTLDENEFPIGRFFSKAQPALDESKAAMRVGRSSDPRNPQPEIAIAVSILAALIAWCF
jgi:hypothetical protein